jgi:RNA polymerase sigma factor (sigma-70 family)
VNAGDVLGGPGGGDHEPGPRELFEVFYPRLAGWTSKLVGDRELAHEIATEAFARLLPRWKNVHDPRAWLYLTAGNLARDHWRRQARERAAYRRLGTPDDAVPPVDVATRVTVRALVEDLPDRFRMPVLLHYYADLPISQVAALLEVAEGTVKRALFDARAIMARRLEEVRP